MRASSSVRAATALLQVVGITIDPLEARPVDVPQQLGPVVGLLEIGEGAQMEGLFDRLVGGLAGVNNHANLVVETANAIQELRAAQVGEAEIDHRHAEILLLDVLQSRFGRTATDDLKSLLLEDLAQELQLGLVVLHNQHL